MYTTNLNQLFDLLEKDLPTWKTTTTASKFNPLDTPDYDVKQLEDGKQQLTLNVLGHDVENIKLYATENEIAIKAKKEEGSSPLISNINAKFSVGNDYDGTKSEAKFSNGLLILTIDKKEARKSKQIQIKIA